MHKCLYFYHLVDFLILDNNIYPNYLIKYHSVNLVTKKPRLKSISLNIIDCNCYILCVINKIVWYEII